MTIVPDSHEQALTAAHEKALAAVRKKPSAENIRAAETAERVLSDYRARKSAEANPGERRFKTLLGEDGVLAYLKEAGWKIEKSKLHTDQHKIKKEPDGTYTKKAVDEYARLCLTRLDGSDNEDQADGLSKAKLENEILEERKRKLQRENEIEEGKWILKSEAEQKHTAKLALLLTAFDNFVHGGKLDESADIMKGDRSKITEFKAFIRRELRVMLAEYAKQPVFTVPQKAVAEAEQLKLEANAD